MEQQAKKSIWTCKLPITLGITAVVALVGTLGVWGTQARIDGAIITSGAVQVETKTQVIQHQEGGVVSAIMVRDGDPVAAGDVLLRLDGTFLESERAMLESQLLEVIARRARLTAEQDGASDVTMPEEMSAFSDNQAETQDIFEGQRRLFLARQETAHAVFDQVDQQKQQLVEQITGITAELDALRAQLALITDERIDAETLVAQQLKPVRELNALKREEVSIQGRIAQILSQIAVTQGRISELEMKKLQYVEQRREEAIAQLRDIENHENNLREEWLALSERLSRLEIRAPMAGVVFNSSVSALQSVIRGGDPIMYIVPQDQPLIVTARASAVDIDKIYPGQQTVLRFSALDIKHVPDIHGTVVRFSADALADEQTGQSFYMVDIIPTESELALLGDQPILPGMPVEAYIQTGERSPLSYLVKPMADYFTRAFREG